MKSQRHPRDRRDPVERPADVLFGVLALGHPVSLVRAAIPAVFGVVDDEAASARVAILPGGQEAAHGTVQFELESIASCFDVDGENHVVLSLSWTREGALEMARVRDVDLG